MLSNGGASSRAARTYLLLACASAFVLGIALGRTSLSLGASSCVGAATQVSVPCALRHDPATIPGNCSCNATAPAQVGAAEPADKDARVEEDAKSARVESDAKSAQPDEPALNPAVDACARAMARALEHPRDFEAMTRAFWDKTLPASAPAERTSASICADAASLIPGVTSSGVAARPNRVFVMMLVNTETQLALLHMHTLQHVADYFVVCESPQAFMDAAPKPLWFQEHAAKFVAFASKVLYVQVDLSQAPMDAADPSDARKAWMRERHMRNELLRFTLTHATLETDVLLTTDVDEIASPVVVRALRECDLGGGGRDRWQDAPGTGLLLHQPRFHADMACFSDNYQPWYGTRVHSAKAAPTVGVGQELRASVTYFSRVPDAGWHLSYVPLGDYTFLRNKYASFSHAKDEGVKAYRAYSDGDWARAVVDGFAGTDMSCRRAETELRAPHGAYARTDMFGPFLSATQMRFATFVERAVCNVAF